MTQRALEGEPGMKALCPSSISGLSHQSGCVPFWKGEAKGILSTVPGGLAGWAPLRVGELQAARARASVRQEPSSLHLSAWGRVEEGGKWASPSRPRGDRLTAGRVMCPCLWGALPLGLPWACLCSFVANKPQVLGNVRPNPGPWIQTFPTLPGPPLRGAPQLMDPQGTMDGFLFRTPPPEFTLGLSLWGTELLCLCQVTLPRDASTTQRTQRFKKRACTPTSEKGLNSARPPCGALVSWVTEGSWEVKKESSDTGEKGESWWWGGRPLSLGPSQGYLAEVRLLMALPRVLESLSWRLLYPAPAIPQRQSFLPCWKRRAAAQMTCQKRPRARFTFWGPGKDNTGVPFGAPEKFKMFREFPGGPMAGTWHFHCWGYVQSLVEELRFPKPCSVAPPPKKRKEI